MGYSASFLSHNLGRTNTVISGLNSASQSKFNSFVTDVYNELGILLLGYSGSRTAEEQWQLRKDYLLGKDGSGQAAAPYYSWHQYGLAMDLVPLLENGIADWNSSRWNEIGKIGERNGLKWGKSFGDTVHFQDTIGKNLEDYQKGNEQDMQKYAALESTLNSNEGLEEQPKKTETNNDVSVLFGVLAAGILGFIIIDKNKK